jgi:hypothetical protein
MNGHKRESEIVDNASPLHSRLPKVDQQREVEARSPEVVDTLREVLVTQLIGAFDFDEQAAVHNQICCVRANMLTLVCDGESGLRSHRNAAQP